MKEGIDRMFKLTCMNCGKEICIEGNEIGYFYKDGITIFETIIGNLEIECSCGNKVVI